MNAYARENMNLEDGTFAGRQWKNISVQEMARFHGLCLKMTIDDRNFGGYEAYFIEDPQVDLARGYNVTVEDSPAWANQVMPDSSKSEQPTIQRLAHHRSATNVASFGMLSTL